MARRNQLIAFVMAMAMVFAPTVLCAYVLAPDWTIEVPLPYTREIAQAFLAAHNSRRRNPPQSAADMRKLKWNGTLAEQAKVHVSKCSLVLDSLNFTVGQNIQLSNVPELSVSTADDTLKLWVEKNLVQYPMNEEGRMGRSTASQVLWANTSSVGCASHWCPNQVLSGGNGTGILTACNYYPPGNYPDKPVFKVDPPCTACPDDAQYCDVTLCTPEHHVFLSDFNMYDDSVQSALP